MKLLDRLNLRRLAKVASIAAISGTLLLGGNAVVNAAPVEDEGMAAFREAYMGQLTSTRMIDQDLSLVAPNFHLDMDSKGQVTADNVMRMSGTLSWTYTNLQKNYSTNSSIPFYIEQAGNDMTLYVQRRGKWSKMLLPGLPAGIVTIWKASEIDVLRQNLDAVKVVKVLKDTPDMRIMNVTLDGNKIAALLEKNSQGSFASLSGDALTEQKEQLNRWLEAIRANDITFAWTVNKPSWTTVTAAFDLTNIMHAYARYVLDESAAGRIVLNDEERDLLDAMGYYAELKSYTTYISPKKDMMINLPANLKNAPENDNSLDDIFAEMTTVVKK
ncbi:MAG: hypothetical protein IJG33_04090 [Selenomonadaceae bacterium]|nr:hypothetical protein [Selenomonadaceae bacterium]